MARPRSIRAARNRVAPRRIAILRAALLAAVLSGAGAALAPVAPAGAAGPETPAATPPPAPGSAAAEAERIRIEAATKALDAELAAGEDPHIMALRGMLAKNPEDVGALVAMGDVYVKRREYEKARGYYLRASQVAPANLEARTHLGTTAYFLGHTDEALHHYEEALALDPDYTVALFEMGAVLRYGKKDLPAAVATWEHFLRLDPKAPEADRIRDLVAEAKAMIAKGQVPAPAPAAPAHPFVPATAPWPGQGADGAK